MSVLSDKFTAALTTGIVELDDQTEYILDEPLVLDSSYSDIVVQCSGRQATIRPNFTGDMTDRGVIEIIGPSNMVWCIGGPPAKITRTSGQGSTPSFGLVVGRSSAASSHGHMFNLHVDGLWGKAAVGNNASEINLWTGGCRLRNQAGNYVYFCGAITGTTNSSSVGHYFEPGCQFLGSSTSSLVYINRPIHDFFSLGATFTNGSTGGAVNVASYLGGGTFSSNFAIQQFAFEGTQPSVSMFNFQAQVRHVELSGRVPWDNYLGGESNVIDLVDFIYVQGTGL